MEGFKQVRLSSLENVKMRINIDEMSGVIQTIILQTYLK